MLLARALYDNASEALDELPFKRGDVLNVLDQHFGGLDGWWLCSIHGREGIAPGNRLKLVHDKGDDCDSVQSSQQQWPHSSTDKVRCSH